MSEKEKLITAYHEGGHALVAAALPGTDPVHKVTILPRGRALGYTMVLPDEDKYSQTRSEMLDKLAYMLGGRAAEEMVFHDPTTGAGNDIEKATSLARAMVTQYGMTERLGAIKLGEQQRRAVPGPRHGPPAQLLRGRRRDRRRGDQEAARQRPPGGLRHPRGEPRRARRAGDSRCWRRRPSTRRRSPRSSSRCGGGRPVPRGPVRRPRALGHPAGRGAARRAANGVGRRRGPGRGRPHPAGRGGDVHGDPGVDAPQAPTCRLGGSTRSARSRGRDDPDFDHAARRGGRPRAADRDRGGPRARGAARDPGPGGPGVRRADRRHAACPPRTC